MKTLQRNVFSLLKKCFLIPATSSNYCLIRRLNKDCLLIMILYLLRNGKAHIRPRDFFVTMHGYGDWVAPLTSTHIRQIVEEGANYGHDYPELLEHVNSNRKNSSERNRSTTDVYANISLLCQEFQVLSGLSFLCYDSHFCQDSLFIVLH